MNIKEIWKNFKLLFALDAGLHVVQEDIKILQNKFEDLEDDVSDLNNGVKDLEDDFEHKVDSCDFEDLKSDFDKVQIELTDYRIQNARLRRAIIKIAEKVDLEFVIDDILNKDEENKNE